MGKKRWNAEGVETIEGTDPAELPAAGERMGYTASGLMTIDLQRQTVRVATAASVSVVNQPDNRIDFSLTGGTLTIPPGWHVIYF